MKMKMKKKNNIFEVLVNVRKFGQKNQKISNFSLIRKNIRAIISHPAGESLCRARQFQEEDRRKSHG